ncbi:MAG: S8 family serine peptidase [Phycisphaerae bacterium]
MPSVSSASAIGSACRSLLHDQLSRVRPALLVLALVLTVFLSPAAWGSANAPAVRADQVGGFATDQIIVRFREDAMVPQALAPAGQALGAAAAVEGPQKRGAAARLPNVARVPQLDDRFHAACRAWQVQAVRPCFSRGFGQPTVAARLGLDRTYLLDVPAGTDARAMLDDFSVMDEVESVSTVGIGTVALIPNDTDFVDQWHLLNNGQTGGTTGVDIGAPEAWDIHAGVEGAVTIAIIDNGVTLHEDYASLVVDSINTVDLSTNYGDTDPPQSCPHGTHVAGIAAAMGNNGIGVAGVYLGGANILRARVLNGCGGTWPPVADGIVWATDNGADVINISLQFYNLTANELTMFEAAVDYAYENGAFVVAAAGNWAGFDVAHPAEFENAMAVAATTHNDSRAIFSNQGPALAVAAPGDDIWSTYPLVGTRYDFLSGTSMATPVVAGLAGLIKSYLPGANPDQIWSLIEDNVIDLGDPGHDIAFGHGRIDALATMQAASLVPRVVASSPVDGAVDARQPSEPNGTSPEGPDAVVLAFSQDPSGLVLGDFAVAIEGAGVSPGVSSLAPQGLNSLQVSLTGPVGPMQRLSLTHVLTDTGVSVGFLPGDVDGNGQADGSDVQALIESLNGNAVLADSQADIDRDETQGPEDLLRLIDLLNGGETYNVYFGATLP